MKDFNVDRKFTITEKQVEKLAESAINVQIKDNRVPFYKTTCKLVMAQSYKTFELARYGKDAINGLAKFIGNVIMSKFIWKPTGLSIANIQTKPKIEVVH